MSTNIAATPSSPTVQGPLSPSSATESAPPTLLEKAPPVTPAKSGLPSSPPPLKPKRKFREGEPIPAVERMRNLRERKVKSQEMFMLEVDEFIEEVAKEVIEELTEETAVMMEDEAREVIGQEEHLEEEEETSWAKASPCGSMAKSTFTNHKAELKGILSNYTLREQMELTMLLAAGFSLPSLVCPLRLTKLRFTVTTRALAGFLSST